MITENDRICFLGDSITFGVGTTKRYFEYIAEKTGAEVYGFGIDGASTAHLFTELQRMEREVGDDFDILCVLIGTNDFNGGVPVGEFFTEKAERVVSSTDETFCGRLNKFFAFVKDKYADKRIVMITPLHRAYAYFGLDNVQQSELYANVIGEYFEKYIEAERRAADIWSIELIDAYRESGLFPLSDAHAKLYFHDDKTDRLHPAAKGHFRLAETILRRI